MRFCLDSKNQRKDSSLESNAALRLACFIAYVQIYERKNLITPDYAGSNAALRSAAKTVCDSDLSKQACKIANSAGSIVVGLDIASSIESFKYCASIFQDKLF